jgi:hypothetical protein
MGCLLQFQEIGKIDTTFLSLIQQASNAALGALNDSDTLVRDAALDLLDSLPARTVEEISLVRQIAEGIQDQRARKVCANSLLYAKPVDEQAKQELEKGLGSTVPEVREAVAEAMKPKK